MKAMLILLAVWGLAASATNPSEESVVPTGKVSLVDAVGERHLA